MGITSIFVVESESEFPLHLRQQILPSESVQVKIAAGVTEMEIVYVAAVPHIRRIGRAFPGDPAGMECIFRLWFVQQPMTGFVACK